MPGRTDNDVKVRRAAILFKQPCYVSRNFINDHHISTFCMKNRWWSQERARKRSKKNVADEESNAADSSKEKSIHKERPKIAKPIKRDLTHKTKQALESTNSLYKREFDLPALPTIELCPLSSLSDELLMDILIPPVPRLGTCPSSIMSNLETDAATSLVALKSGRTPVEGSDYKEGNDPSQIRLEPTRCEIATPNSNKWSYPSPLGVLNYSPKSFDNNDVDKENLAPTLAVSSSSLNIPNLGYVRKWTYPPPPSPMLQARPHLTVKASEIFSPSYGTIHKKGNSITPPSTLPLDTLPLCDSGPFIKRTTMPMDQAWPTSELRIKWSPLVTKNNRDTTCLFSPLPVSERSETNVKPNHFSQTVTNVFESDSFSNKCFLRPSPVKSSKI